MTNLFCYDSKKLPTIDVLTIVFNHLVTSNLFNNNKAMTHIWQQHKYAYRARPVNESILFPKSRLFQDVNRSESHKSILFPKEQTLFQHVNPLESHKGILASESHKSILFPKEQTVPTCTSIRITQKQAWIPD